MLKTCLILLAAALLFSLPACAQAPAPAVAPVEIIDPAKTVQLLDHKTFGGISRIIPEAETERNEETYYKNTHNLDLDLAGVVYTNSLNDGLALLRSGKIAAFEILEATARYTVLGNKDLKLYVQGYRPSTVHTLFNKEKKDQRDLVDTALQAMLKDGTLDGLRAKWIDNMAADKAPPVVSMPAVEGTAVLKVGITGQEPPLDYLASNSTPSGFCVAVLSEVSRRTGLKIEFVTVKTAERYSALQSGRTDAFLWKTEMGSMADNMQAESFEDIDPSSVNFLFSYPYLETHRSLIVLKNSK